MNNSIFLAALAALAIGHTSNLEAHSLQSHPLFGCNPPLGNTTASQIANQNSNAAGSGYVIVEAMGLAGVVPAMAVTTLDCAPSGIIASPPVSTAWDLNWFAIPSYQNQPGALAEFVLVKPSRQMETKQIIMVKKTIAAKPAPPAAPAVSVVKKTVFAFKTRPVIAPKGLQTANYMGTVNMQGTENGEEFNRVEVTFELEAVDGKNKAFVLSANYNIMPGGRGANSFVKDYNAWTGSNLTEDDLYESFDGEADKGKALVVEVGHRKIGNDWEAYIMAFHPEGYTGEATVEA